MRKADCGACFGRVTCRLHFAATQTGLRRCDTVLSVSRQAIDKSPDSGERPNDIFDIAKDGGRELHLVWLGTFRPRTEIETASSAGRTAGSPARRFRVSRMELSDRRRRVPWERSFILP